MWPFDDILKVGDRVKRCAFLRSLINSMTTFLYQVAVKEVTFSPSASPLIPATPRLLIWTQLSISSNKTRSGLLSCSTNSCIHSSEALARLQSCSRRGIWRSLGHLHPTLKSCGEALLSVPVVFNTASLKINFFPWKQVELNTSSRFRNGQSMTG